jgi:predicted 2-oxoglutarate/Fe(II)-dependent dioxygenase YbiX
VTHGGHQSSVLGALLMPVDEQIARALWRADALLKSGDKRGALAAAQSVLHLCSDSPALHGVLGGLCLAAGDSARARNHLARAEPSAVNLCHLAAACVKCGDVQAAIAAADASVALDPSPRNMARHWREIARMVDVDFEDLDRDLRSKDQMVAFRRLAGMRGVQDAAFGEPMGVAVWTGQRAAHLVVRCLEGFGDAVQYVRWCFEASRRVDRLTVATHAKLVRLFARSGLCAVDYEALDLTGCDAHISAGVMPAVLGDVYGPGGSYLAATRPLTREGPLRVGVCWLASKADRSTDLAALEPLRTVAGAEFFSFTHATTPPAWMQVLPLGDFADTADQMARMDLIVTVDTVTAHLAGAIGRPVWIALPEPADWRWGTGERTGWYSTARLFRGDLARSFERMAEALANEVAPWATSDVIFTADECARIVECLQRLPAQAGALDSGDAAKFLARQTFVTPAEPGLEWAQQRIMDAVADAAAKLGIATGPQRENGHFLRYSLGGRFDWHRDDYGDGDRALSLTLQLSDPDDYEGGRLVINSPDGSRRVIAERTLGALNCFRSQCLHAVAPVTRGERAALVQWHPGPA